MRPSGWAADAFPGVNKPPTNVAVVVTKDLPAGVAHGNPCRVVRAGSS